MAPLPLAQYAGAVWRSTSRLKPRKRRFLAAAALRAHPQYARVLPRINPPRRPRLVFPRTPCSVAACSWRGVTSCVRRGAGGHRPSRPRRLAHGPGSRRSRPPGDGPGRPLRLRDGSGTGPVRGGRRRASPVLPACGARSVVATLWQIPDKPGAGDDRVLRASSVRASDRLRPCGGLNSTISACRVN